MAAINHWNPKPGCPIKKLAPLSCGKATIKAKRTAPEVYVDYNPPGAKYLFSAGVHDAGEGQIAPETAETV